MKTGKSLRSDIQFLRAYAVLLVLFYHAGLNVLKNGYLGVDIFFVVSGYLITDVIAKGIKAGTFSFKEFYARRARRLLPATFVVVLAVVIVSLVWLDQQQIKYLKWQVFGSFSFTSNYFLYSQSDYFLGDAKLKPLLHMWSLSIEEQFYIVLPIIFTVTKVRHWKSLIVIFVVLSLFSCWLVFQKDPSLAFYSLPTRWWEIGVGSWASISCFKHKTTLVRILFWPALLVMGALPFFPLSGPHPGGNALLIVVATVIVLLRNHSLFEFNMLDKPFGFIGKISYSLYLVHWPVYAFLNNSWFGLSGPEPGPLVRVALILLCFVLSVLLYWGVEQRFRYAGTWNDKKTLVVYGLLSAFLASVLFFEENFFSQKNPSLTKLDPNYGLSMECQGEDVFSPAEECKTKERPETLVWGDSFAAHLIPGLRIWEEEFGGFIQATKGICAPVPGIAQYDEQRGTNWSRDCVKFNDSVLAYVLASTELKRVVISSAWKQVVDESTKVYHGEKTLIAPPDVGGTVAALVSTIMKIQDSGKEVLLVSPTPHLSFDAGICNVRKQMGLPNFGEFADCSVSVPIWKEKSMAILKLNKDVVEETGVAFVDLSEYLCDGKMCMTELYGTILIRDNYGHLSIEGAHALFKAMDRERIFPPR